MISGSNHDRLMASEAISDAVRFLGIPGTVRQGKGERREGEEGEGGGGEGEIEMIYYISVESIPHH